MDMKIVIDNIKRERYNPEHWYMLDSIVGDMALSEDESAQLFKLAGLSDDAAEFMAEWYPEYVCCALNNLRYTYDFDNGIRQFATEKELAEYLNDLGCSREEYEERYGSIIEDAAFNGIVVTE